MNSSIVKEVFETIKFPLKKKKKTAFSDFLQILEEFAETHFLKDRIKRLWAIFITEQLLLETAAVISKDICEDKIMCLFLFSWISASC